MFYAPYASIVVWKSQNGAKTVVNLGAVNKLRVLTRYGRVAVIFLNTTFNSQRNNFNDIILFQNSPVQPLPLRIGGSLRYPPFLLSSTALAILGDSFLWRSKKDSYDMR
jgi:hypothetical protein